MEKEMEWLQQIVNGINVIIFYIVRINLIIWYFAATNLIKSEMDAGDRVREWVECKQKLTVDGKIDMKANWNSSHALGWKNCHYFHGSMRYCCNLKLWVLSFSSVTLNRNSYHQLNYRHYIFQSYRIPSACFCIRLLLLLSVSPLAST